MLDYEIITFKLSISKLITFELREPKVEKFCFEI